MVSLNPWIRLEIEADNWLLMLAAVIATGHVINWKIKNHLSEFVNSVVNCFIWIFGSIGVRASWFAISRHFSPEDEGWSPLMYEWRWLLVMLTAWACTWGFLNFLQLINESSNKEKYITFVSIYALSRVMGYY